MAKKKKPSKKPRRPSPEPMIAEGKLEFKLIETILIGDELVLTHEIHKNDMVATSPFLVEYAERLAALCGKPVSPTQAYKIWFSGGQQLTLEEGMNPDEIEIGGEAFDLLTMYLTMEEFQKTYNEPETPTMPTMRFLDAVRAFLEAQSKSKLSLFDAYQFWFRCHTKFKQLKKSLRPTPTLQAGTESTPSS